MTSLFESSSPDSPETDISNDPTCVECGAPLTYSGRGRRPTRCDLHKRSGSKSSDSSTRRNGKVSDTQLNQACATLHDGYELALIPLMMLSPTGGQVWTEQIAGLDERNHRFLANNVDLVKRINSVGERGGATAFYASHVMALVPVVYAIMYDFRKGALAPHPDNATTFDDMPGTDPGSSEVIDMTMRANNAANRN